jgi:type IV pilus assembly protein PilW
MTQRTGSAGFTLVEMMIAIAVFGILMVGVYAVFQAQVKNHYTQQQVIEMQGSLRAVMDLMEYEIKMAGFDPDSTGEFGVIRAESYLFEFAFDADEDGVADGAANNEQIRYQLSNDASGGEDGGPDGQNDGGVCNLLRNGSIVALNIDALNFIYLTVDGSEYDPADPVDPDNLDDIRSVQVTLVARSSAEPSAYSYGFTDARVYENQKPETILPAQNDSYRRRLLSTEVKCRNLGI